MDEEFYKDLDLRGEREYKTGNYAVGTSTFRTFIMTEKADPAYNQMLNRRICSEINVQMGDIYIPSPDTNRTASKIKLTRRGASGAYQFEVRINNDGTLCVEDNSQARGFVKLREDGTKQFIMLNAKEYFTSKKTGIAAIPELIAWLKENYDKYETINAASRDNRDGITARARNQYTSKANKGPKRVTDMMRNHGISDVSAFLRNGGNIRDLI